MQTRTCAPSPSSSTTAARDSNLDPRKAHPPVIVHPRPRTLVAGRSLPAFVLVFTLLLSFTGYLLPWDQLAIWAITVGSNMARATPLLGHEGPGSQLLKVGDVAMVHAGSDARFALLGGRFVGEGALLRFYVLHCVGIPLVAGILMAVHFWRVRKDGGISGPL